VLRWIPPASSVDAVRTVSRGSYGLAAVQLLYTAAVIALILRWWYHSLVRLMVAPDASTLRAAPSGDTGKGRGDTRRSFPVTALVPRRLVAGRTGTVMERQFRYMWRDPRTKASFATALAVGLLIPVVSLAQHGGSVYQSVWAAGLLGIQMNNQFGMDGPAFWTVVATTATRRDAALELRGRALALAVVAVPYITAVTTGMALLMHRARDLPEVLGLGLAFVGALVATGVHASARYPYAVARDNPFSNAAPGQSGLAALNLLAGTFSGAALCLPLLALTVSLHVTGHHALLWTVLPCGAAYGAVLASLALRFTAPRMLGRLPEILAVVAKS
jgi:ABC-2 type transport system permease protein